MKYLAPAVILSGLLFAGCGDSSKATTAIAKIQSRPGPGYVRVVNLSKDDIDFEHKNRTVVAAIPSMSASRMMPIGTGTVTVKLIANGKPMDVKHNLTSGVGSSIILMPDHTTKIIDKEIRYATSDSNVHIVPVDAGGKLPSTLALKGADAKSLPLKDGLITLAQGTYSCPDGTDVVIGDRIAYTLFVVAAKDKVYYILGKNAADEKPAGQGQSAA